MQNYVTFSVFSVLSVAKNKNRKNPQPSSILRRPSFVHNAPLTNP
jgi:hypothetical protein